jgi:hypothetical protein
MTVGDLSSPTGLQQVAPIRGPELDPLSYQTSFQRSQGVGCAASDDI